MKLINKESIDYINVVQNPVFGMKSFEINTGLKIFGITIIKPWSGYKDIFDRKIQEKPNKDEVDIGGVLFTKATVYIVTKSGEEIFHSRHDTIDLANKEAFKVAKEIGINTIRI